MRKDLEKKSLLSDTWGRATGEGIDGDIVRQLEGSPSTLWRGGVELKVCSRAITRRSSTEFDIYRQQFNSTETGEIGSK